eukprot:6488986-Amphidinium_carterae.4
MSIEHESNCHLHLDNKKTMTAGSSSEKLMSRGGVSCSREATSQLVTTARRITRIMMQGVFERS